MFLLLFSLLFFVHMFLPLFLAPLFWFLFFFPCFCCTLLALCFLWLLFSPSFWWYFLRISLAPFFLPSCFCCYFWHFSYTCFCCTFLAPFSFIFLQIFFSHFYGSFCYLHVFAAIFGFFLVWPNASTKTHQKKRYELIHLIKPWISFETETAWNHCLYPEKKLSLSDRLSRTFCIPLKNQPSPHWSSSWQETAW